MNKKRKQRKVGRFLLEIITTLRCFLGSIIFNVGENKTTFLRRSKSSGISLMLFFI